MRYINMASGENIEEQDVDASKGWLVDGTVLSPDEADEAVKFYYPMDQKQLALTNAQIAKQNLSETDYISAKSLDSLLSCESLTDLLKTLKELHDEYVDVLEQRASWRQVIRDAEEVIVNGDN